MRKFALPLLAALMFSAPAFAVGVKKPVNAAPLPAPVTSWTGWYAGGNVGYGWGKNTGNGYSSISDPLGAGFALIDVLPGVRPSGVTGGGQIGYNWQVSPLWVVGLIADLQASDARASATAPALLSLRPNTTESNSADMRWFGTVRGKVGYLVNTNVLVYGTGGLAYGRVAANTVFSDPMSGNGNIGLAGSASAVKTGWTAGAGAEYALSNHWSVGAEYLYVDLGSISVTETPSTPNAVIILTGTTQTSTPKFSDHIARAFINYKFGQ